MPGQDVEAAADDQDIAVLKGDAHAAVEIDVGHVRVPAQLRQDLRRQVLVVGRGGKDRGPEKDVPADGPAHPVIHRLAEGADHHRHRDEHPQGAGQGGDGHGTAAQGPGQVAAAQIAGGSQDFPECGLEALSQQAGRQGGEEGKRQEDEESRHKSRPGGAVVYLPVSSHPRQDQGHQTPPEDEARLALDFFFQFLPVPHGLKLGAGRLPGGQTRPPGEWRRRPGPRPGARDLPGPKPPGPPPACRGKRGSGSSPPGRPGPDPPPEPVPGDLPPGRWPGLQPETGAAPGPGSCPGSGADRSPGGGAPPTG